MHCSSAAAAAAASSHPRACTTRKSRLGRKKETTKTRGLLMRSVEMMSCRTCRHSRHSSGQQGSGQQWRECWEECWETGGTLSKLQDTSSGA